MNRDYDVVIVGSGAGGGAVADRLIPLAEKGARIAVLEAGPWYDEAGFTQRELEMMALYWHGAAWLTRDGAVTLAAGKAVGGSTLVYTGVTFRLPEAVLAEWNLPDLTMADLTPRFGRLERDLHVVEPDGEMVNENNRRFRAACDRLGWPVENLRLNIKDCEGSGFCNLGCAAGAKQGTHVVQLPRAMNAGIEVIPNCAVARISEGAVEARVAPAPGGTKPGPWPPGEVRIRARAVVLAAGSPGSPAILLRSGFGASLPALGRFITLHPALTLYGVHPEKIDGFRGFPKTFYTPKFSQSHGYYLETAFYYPFVTTKHLGLWGRDLTSVMGAYDRLMAVLVLSHDPARADNRITLDRKGAIAFQYAIGPETVDALCHAQIQSARIFLAAGCERVVLPCGDRRVVTAKEAETIDLDRFVSPKNFIPNRTPVSSAHPQGGCRMGQGPADSVTDVWGEVHGAPSVFVADASLFPGSAHVNPYLTVMALADRVGERVADRLG
jgi:choline dehydrogenase-like flavoprotein